MCTPWEAVRFERIMFKDIPDDQCDFCLPDCSETQYTTSTTVVPFRRCDYKNLGVSYLCDLYDLNLPEPRIWGSQVIEEYSNRGNGELPWFIKKQVCTLAGPYCLDVSRIDRVSMSKINEIIFFFNLGTHFW